MNTATQTLSDQRTIAEIDKLLAERSKLLSESAKMERERAWYPAIVVATALAAGATLAKLFL